MERPFKCAAYRTFKVPPKLGLECNGSSIGSIHELEPIIVS